MKPLTSLFRRAASAPRAFSCGPSVSSRRQVATATGLALLFAGKILAQNVYPTPYAFGTLAGSATEIGSADGSANQARFSNPRGLALDVQGNLYVADQDNHVIRKVTPAGVVTTVAGKAGVAGSADGALSEARFNSPHGLTLDAAGNIYVADAGNYTIRKISVAGLVTTVAGIAGSAGTEDGPAQSARFDDPFDLVLDSTGSLFVTEAQTCTVRRIAKDGSVTTFAGRANSQGTADGVGSAARFRFPVGIAIDSADNLYVGNDYEGIVRKITPAQVVTTLAGSPSDPKTFGSIGSADGVGPAAGFRAPEDVAVDAAGNVYVTDASNYTIRKITPAGVVTTLAGATGKADLVDGTGIDARFHDPIAIAVDPAGSLYVLDLTPTPGPAPNILPYTFPAVIRKGSVALAPTPATARLANMSARANVGTDSNILIVGFVAGGSGSKNMLLRGAGSALAGFGISNYLAQPSLGLFNAQSVQINSNAGWNNNAALSATFMRVGAFSYSTGSADSALEASLPTNLPFTAQVSGMNRGTGVSIAEIYDADANLLTSPSRLANISARANVGTGTDVLIAGFVIGGTGADTILIRGIGPTLATYGLNGLLANPVLTLFDGQGNVITSNQGWQNPPVAPGGVWTGRVLPLSAGHADFSKVGAFDLGNGTADSALIVTLPPGNYTAQISGVNSTGVAEVEVYEDN